jgi:hypothetical protein
MISLQKHLHGLGLMFKRRGVQNLDTDISRDLLLEFRALEVWKGNQFESVPSFFTWFQDGDRTVVKKRT